MEGNEYLLSNIETITECSQKIIKYLKDNMEVGKIYNFSFEYRWCDEIINSGCLTEDNEVVLINKQGKIIDPIQSHDIDTLVEIATEMAFLLNNKLKE